MAADEVIDLSVATDEGDAKAEARTGQFQRDLSHLLIGEDGKGPRITIGPYNLQFKEHAPVTALAELIGGENRVEAMRQYVLLSLEEGSRADFAAVLGRIDIEGLGELIGVLGEGYTSFPEKS